MKKLRAQGGFSLIELLIVVAVIGIIASIAVPMYMDYRHRSFNAAALSDLRYVKVSLEAHFSDSAVYPY